MNALQVIHAIEAAGGNLLLLPDGGVRVEAPRGAVDRGVRDALRDLKQEVVEILRAQDRAGIPHGAGRVHDEGRAWIPPPRRSGLCPCDQEPAATRLGLCVTCAGAILDATHEDRSSDSAAREERS